MRFSEKICNRRRRFILTFSLSFSFSYACMLLSSFGFGGYSGTASIVNERASSISSPRGGFLIVTQGWEGTSR